MHVLAALRLAELLPDGLDRGAAWLADAVHLPRVPSDHAGDRDHSDTVVDGEGALLSPPARVVVAERDRGLDLVVAELDPLSVP